MTSKKVDVTIDRDKYIGGSDIAAIMGLSPFRTRYDLLREKALGETSEFEGNAYTEYGHDMEPKIRDYINHEWGKAFEDDQQRIDGDLRYNADGYDKDGEGCVLEVKTTSRIAEYRCKSHEEETEYLRENYKGYMVQLLLGMKLFGAPRGVLAIYERPGDFNTEFEDMRLDWFIINAEEWADVEAEIEEALNKFREDVRKLKNNPDLDEAGLAGKELMALANDAVEAVKELAEFEAQMKAAEKKAKAAKEALYQAMNSNEIDSWTLNEGVKVTRIKEKPDTTIQAIDEDRLRAEQPEIAEQYSVEKVKRGHKGYVKISVPKDE